MVCKGSQVSCNNNEELCRAILETEQGKADALGVAFLKSAFTKIVSVQLFWRKGKQLVLHVFICKTGYVEHQCQELAGFREIAKHYAFLTKAN